MIIFPTEIQDGLENVIQANASLAFIAEPKIVTPENLNKSIQEKVFKAIATNLFQPDLHYLDTILVTTGWNKNTDILDRHEVWSARNTPEDKPFNWEHDCGDIIGHITGSYPVDTDMNIIPEDTTEDDLPDIFHIVTNAVLYKEYDKQHLKERAEKTWSEIQDGKWFVSMEALFSGFDYGVITPEGQQKVIRRNEATAFLTKHLKQYGGTGEYQGYTLGRLIRNFVFSGKGLVRKPANPESVILKTEAFVTKSVENLLENKDFGYTYSSGNDTDKESEVMAEELDKIKEQLDKVSKERDDLKAKLDQIDVTNYKNVIAGLETNVKTITETNALLLKEKDELKVKLDASEKLAKDVNDQLVAIKAAEKKANRVAALVKAGITEDNAKVNVEKFVALSDEQFDTMVAFIPAPAPAVEPKKEEPVTEVTPTQAAENDKVLEGAKPNQEPNLTVDNNKSENLRVALASVFEELMNDKTSDKE